MGNMGQETKDRKAIDFPIPLNKEDILNDYRLIVISRECSYLGRREVLGAGKAKFGIFGDGKELAQVCLAKFFKEGDFRCGYYRDQTLMMALGLLTIEQFFAQLYADADPVREPHSAGRQMSNHFCTPFINKNGEWLPLKKLKNSTADVSPLASQMPRALGIALASKLIREHPESFKNLIENGLGNGTEVCWAIIGDASTSEGIFWETLVAATTLQVPIVFCIWDDGYGISVPKKYQTPKESISKILTGFLPDEREGLHIFYARNWSYVELLNAFSKASEIARKRGEPCLVHIDEVTQPQGHSTSGSHERYKTPERLKFEVEFCPIRKFKEFLLENEIASEDELKQIEEEAQREVRLHQQKAWKDFQDSIKKEANDFYKETSAIMTSYGISNSTIKEIFKEFTTKEPIYRKDIVSKGMEITTTYINKNPEVAKKIYKITEKYEKNSREMYTKYLYSEDHTSTLKVDKIPIEYDENAQEVYGFMILRDNFDRLLAQYPELIIFGEDCGKLGDVNQGLQGLQAKYGEHRVFDTGIREATIVGQAIGLAMRGFRPIAEIQYLDYLLYALQIMSDDLATVRWRSANTQKAPVIIRTRGHRLEGIWHTGSYIMDILDLCRGMYVCVPRDMTRAAGMYNTLLKGSDPALVIEVLNGYRHREKMPKNIGEFTIPLGVPEIIKEGKDITLVTYGALIKISLEAVEILKNFNIDVEIIDVQTLLPYDIHGIIVNSIKKTNKVVFVDEDMPGGTTAYMMHKTLIEQNGFNYLDIKPECITATETRTPYGDDGNFFCKPNKWDIVRKISKMLHEYNPSKFPSIFE